ncbi:3-methyl-2-oxobutanoate hydroxymethyltransferase [Leptolyngbya sp. GB1-A1]|uniref:3-methyl-2-oxobutanoate hydroxymethyltransferase n=1 Tax=Leptolyngbya sp. GB1-A1 TaxID=2933908 RepID=UPI00329748E6
MAVTTQQLIRYKQQGRKIVVLTAWDYLIAQVLDQSGVDVILVGDSLAMVALGYETTVPLTLDEILHHAKAVRRAVKNALLVLDLPFLSYQEDAVQAMRSAGRALKEAGVQAVKLEGGYPAMAETVKRLVQAGIPVMGHVGLTPQSVHQLGGFRKQGTSPEAAARILEESIALQAAGAFSIILEHIPADLAAQITEKLTIPTIGIGAGDRCDGQVLVTSDLLGMGEWQPPFAKKYANLREAIGQAVQQFGDEVRGSGTVGDEGTGE